MYLNMICKSFSKLDNLDQYKVKGLNKILHSKCNFPQLMHPISNLYSMFYNLFIKDLLII